MRYVIGAVVGLWLIGRLSRVSANHPANVLRANLSFSQARTALPAPQIETARTQEPLVAGEGD